MPAPSFGVIISEIRHTHKQRRQNAEGGKEGCSRDRDKTPREIRNQRMRSAWEDGSAECTGINMTEGMNGPSAGFRISSPSLASVCHALNWRQLTARGALPMGNAN